MMQGKGEAFKNVAKNEIATNTVEWKGALTTLYYIHNKLQLQKLFH